MKNKRKYDDALPATAAEISKKNLGKLQKLTKVDPPKVKVSRQFFGPNIFCEKATDLNRF